MPVPTVPGASPDVLGLQGRSTSNPALVVLLVCPSWNLASDAEKVKRLVSTVLDDARKYADARGTLDDFTYLNYAADIASYGQENQEFLQGRAGCTIRVGFGKML